VRLCASVSMSFLGVGRRRGPGGGEKGAGNALSGSSRTCAPRKNLRT